MSVAAFFDFDKTLVAKDSQELEGIHVLLKNHWYQSPFVILGLLGAWVSDQLEEGGLVADGLSAKLYVMAYRGVKLSKLTKCAPELYSTQIRPRLYPDMLRLMEEHRKRGHLVILLSATSEHIILPFANEVSIDGCFSTYVECDSNGICTGVSKILHGREKALVVEELAQARKLDLQQSWAYSDHHSDIPFLQKVGNPVAVNATKRLGDVAQRLGWRKLTTLPLSGRQASRKEHKKKSSVLWLALLFVGALFVVRSHATETSRGTIRGAAIPKRRSKVEKLCLVSYEPITHVDNSSSGTIVYYRQIISAALDRGIDVQVVEPHRMDGLPEIPYPLFERPDGGGVLTTVRLEAKGDLGGGIVSFGPRVVRQQMRHNIILFDPDVIVIPDALLMAADAIVAAPGSYEAQKLGAALVYTIHSNIVDIAPLYQPWTGSPLVQRLFHMFHKNMLGHASMVFARSTTQEEHIRDETGFQGPIQINRFGLSKVCSAPVRTQETRFEVDAASEIAQSANRSQCQITFASIGRLSNDKHVEEILDATEKLLENDTMLDKVCLVLAGPDQGLLGTVQKSMQRFPNNIFYEGLLNQHQVGSLIQSSDALVFVGGKVETSSIIIGDAKDCDSPVLAVAAPGSTWWQNRDDLGHVDLRHPSPSESMSTVLMNRMKAFVENDGFRSELNMRARHNPDESGSVETALEEFLQQLDSTYEFMQKSTS